MIKIITDSASDINKEEAQKLGVIMLPMEIRFKNEIYLDGVNISLEKFYEKIEKEQELPKTSQIIPYQFIEAYENVVNNGDEALVITISSKLSGTYNNAVISSKEYEDKIMVVDSITASMGEKLLVLYALELIKQNKTLKEIKDELDNVKHRVRIVAKLDNLKHLRKGGRISTIVAIGGDLLAIKPVISIINGEVKLLGKARGSKNGNNLLSKLVKEDGIDFSMPFAAIYSGTSDELLKVYLEDFKDLYINKNIPIYPIGTTIGTHIGPNAIGVSYFSLK